MAEGRSGQAFSKKRKNIAALDNKSEDECDMVKHIAIK